MAETQKGWTADGGRNNPTLVTARPVVSGYWRPAAGNDSTEPGERLFSLRLERVSKSFRIILSAREALAVHEEIETLLFGDLDCRHRGTGVPAPPVIVEGRTVDPFRCPECRERRAERTRRVALVLLRLAHRPNDSRWDLPANPTVIGVMRTVAAKEEQIIALEQEREQLRSKLSHCESEVAALRAGIVGVR